MVEHEDTPVDLLNDLAYAIGWTFLGICALILLVVILFKFLPWLLEQIGSFFYEAFVSKKKKEIALLDVKDRLKFDEMLREIDERYRNPASVRKTSQSGA